MTAMIFAAGLGTRFKPWTDNHPKALALVNGKTLLQRNIEYLQRNGIYDLIVNVHHFPDQIRKAIEENNAWGSKILISDESDQVLETGGGLLNAADLFPAGERFITCNVDILTNLDISKLLSFHQQKGALISFGVTNRQTSRYLLFDQNSRLCGWKNIKTGLEKIAIPASNASLGPRLEKAYSCVAVFEYEVFKLIPFTGKFSMIDLYLALAPAYQIYGYDHSGDLLVDVGKPESIAVAEAVFP